MNIETNALIGLLISSANYEDDCLKLAFEDDSHLVIYNNWSIESSVPNLNSVNRRDISECIGKKVINFFTKSDFIMMKIASDISIKISLADDDWKGPEAAVLYKKEIPLIVWN